MSSLGVPRNAHLPAQERQNLFKISAVAERREFCTKCHFNEDKQKHFFDDL
jgi:nitrate reductase cytochrome c-type subunit